ncbi:hypothetical protein FGG08_002247 [Glutinoglossum americanum]|uniref:S-adenosyl-L-methionine-dependent methyltransferase n=1 Tax=Glutinoglossum americanum TaxID=1670608 RepID=A0A9P8I503_9PEZI|nr:hypothetical protein FGG08_002247 [Glutinoglossum americanum]
MNSANTLGQPANQVHYQPENDRLDMAHHLLITRMHGKLHLAPIGDHPQRILDLGCGTGLWAVEMGMSDILETLVWQMDVSLTCVMPTYRGQVPIRECTNLHFPRLTSCGSERLTRWPTDALHQVIGNDLSPIQPGLYVFIRRSKHKVNGKLTKTLPRVPPNVRFEIDDMEKTWTYAEDFDYIHGRYLMAAIADWPKLMDQTFKHTKPGGWAEFQDFDVQYHTDDGSLKPEHHISKWLAGLIEAAKKVGREPSPGPLLGGWLRDAGFANVTTERFPLPIGTWPKDPSLVGCRFPSDLFIFLCPVGAALGERRGKANVPRVQKRIGAWNYLQISEGVEAFTLRLFTKVLDWSIEEVQVLLGFVRSELKDSKIHAHAAYGQKPEEK